MNLEPLPYGPTRPERLGELLAILWADADFWQLMDQPGGETEVGNSLAHHIEIHYCLNILYPPAVWRELAHNPGKRYLAFSLMVAQPGLFFNENREFYHDYDECWSLAHWIGPENLGNLVHQYINRPYSDLRLLLIRQCSDPSALAILKRALMKLCEDIEWCQKNPGQLPAVAAPTPPRKMRSLENAFALEGMVELIRKQPEISQYTLAKKYFPSKNASRNLKVTAAHRRLAKQALLLAQHRERLPVKWKKPIKKQVSR